MTPGHRRPYAFRRDLPPPDLHSFPTRRSSDLAILTLPVGLIIGFLVALAQQSEEKPLRQRHQEADDRSEEHTSELQSRGHLVCRLLLEKKKRRSQASSLSPVRRRHCVAPRRSS